MWVKFIADISLRGGNSIEENYVWFNEKPTASYLEDHIQEWLWTIDEYHISQEDCRFTTTSTVFLTELPEEIRQKKINKCLKSIERSVAELVLLGYGKQKPVSNT